MERKVYQIPETEKKKDIIDAYDDIHKNIEKVNVDLMDLFSQKELQLNKLYKEEMSKAQSKLMELKELTKEEQLVKKMQEKKENLQKEKKKFIETSLYFSDKCKKFKSTLDKVIINTKELESEIQFLNEQIIYADKHNAKLKEELKEIKEEIQEIAPDTDFEKIIEEQQAMNIPQKSKLHRDLTNIKNSRLGTSSVRNFNNISESFRKSSLISDSKKYISPYAKNIVMKPKKEYTQQDLENARQELQRQTQIEEKLNSLLNDQCFQETEFEKIFLQCINTVKKTKEGKQQSKLPKIGGQSDEISQQQSQQAEDKTIDFTTVSNLDFNDFDKRQILDEFLQRDEIKRYLYCLIFPQEEK